MQTSPRPTDIRLHQKSRILEIRYDDGAHYQLPCEYLRVLSPSAEVRGHMPGQEKLQVGKEAVNITDIQPIGSYAIKIFFDDGHHTGLYDWRYLHELGQKQSVFWAQYIDRLHAAGHRRSGPDPFRVLREEA